MIFPKAMVRGLEKIIHSCRDLLVKHPIITSIGLGVATYFGFLESFSLVKKNEPFIFYPDMAIFSGIVSIVSYQITSHIKYLENKGVNYQKLKNSVKKKKENIIQKENRNFVAKTIDSFIEKPYLVGILKATYFLKQIDI